MLYFNYMGKIIRIDTLHSGDRLKCSANGDGVRIIVWFLGCDVRCNGCHNSEYWDFDNPKFEDFSNKHVQFVISEMKTNIDIYSGLSILGGEPFAKKNIDDILILCEKFKSSFPQKNIWIWSGHMYEWLRNQDGEYGNKIKHILELCDFLIDGPFDINRRNISLKFRGSENQHIINLRTKEVVN